MIINDEHNFIFVHVFRTGGSSINQTLGTTIPGTHTKLETIDNWHKYFSFGVVRNPWDKIVSGYYHSIKRKKISGTFDQYVQQFSKGTLKTSKKYAQHNMLKNCSYVIRFEHLQEDFNDVCDIVGIEQRTLPHAHSTKHAHYTEMYNDDQQRIIADALSGDIEQYGFTFYSTATKNFGHKNDDTNIPS